MKELRQVSVIGMGLLGASVTLGISRSFTKVKSVGYSHRAGTRQKAEQFGVADVIVDDIGKCVTEADLVVLATPICTFEEIMLQISGSLKKGCIVTDVGSTKSLPHRWAKKCLGKDVRYVGSHPIAGSEQRGLEFARDDLFFRACCILTKNTDTDTKAISTLRKFWSQLGCIVTVMKPTEHDRIFGQVSHVPHMLAAALVNSTGKKDICFAGKGFIDTTRVASGPENVWTDIFLTNKNNTVKSVDGVIKELVKLRNAVEQQDLVMINKLLSKARKSRAELINYKINKNELL